MRSLDDLQPAPRGTTGYLCPVDGCDWFHYEPPARDFTRPDSAEHVAGVLRHADPGLREWNDVLSSAVQNTMLVEVKRVEGIVAAHFATHAHVDFLLTINRLRGLLVENGIDPQTETAHRPLPR